MSATRRYEWARGYNGKIEPEKAHKELNRIRGGNDGELSADTVVKAARPKSSVLHGQVFDRAQGAAAEEYYKANARLLIRSVLVVFGEKPDTKTRAFSIVREEESQVAKGRTAKFYGSTEEALKHPDHRQYVLASALREAAAWKKRFSALSELAQIFRAIDEVAEQVL